MGPYVEIDSISYSGRRVLESVIDKVTSANLDKLEKLLRQQHKEHMQLLRQQHEELMTLRLVHLFLTHFWGDRSDGARDDFLRQYKRMKEQVRPLLADMHEIESAETAEELRDKMRENHKQMLIEMKHIAKVFGSKTGD